MIWYTIGCAIVLTLLWYWIQKSYNHWFNKGLTNPPLHPIFGNMLRVFTQKASFAEVLHELHEYFSKNNCKHGGIFFSLMPIYMPVDPMIVKQVVQTDFAYFIDRGIYYNESSDPLSAHLFALEGQQWKNLREKLTPTFTTAKLKMMFNSMTKCSEQLIEVLQDFAGKQPVEIKDILARFTTDIIGTCAFGITCNSLKSPDSEFKERGERFFQKTVWENIIAIFTYILPDVMRLFNTKAIEPNCSKFFLKVIADTVKYREEKNIYRKDFMHLLLQLKNRGKLDDDNSILPIDTKSSENTITFNELAAQAFVFFVAGYETSSTTMTFCLYELPTNHDIQDKAIKEVETITKKYNGQITYEGLKEMTYLEKVISETLRKYPPLAFLNRVCVQEYNVPGTDIVLEKGTKVVVSTLGIQRDENYYPNPDKFDPERFSEENKSARLPCTYMPFGEGPRICIGMRFGQLQTKIGLAALLQNYRFSINPKTKLPIKMDPTCYILTTQGGMWLDLKRIN